MTGDGGAFGTVSPRGGGGWWGSRDSKCPWQASPACPPPRILNSSLPSLSPDRTACPCTMRKVQVSGCRAEVWVEQGEGARPAVECCSEVGNAGIGGWGVVSAMPAAGTMGSAEIRGVTIQSDFISKSRNRGTRRDGKNTKKNSGFPLSSRVLSELKTRVKCNEIRGQPEGSPQTSRRRWKN